MMKRTTSSRTHRAKGSDFYDAGHPRAGSARKEYLSGESGARGGAAPRGAGTYRIRIIHGYHGGTVLRDMVRREYGAHPRVKRVEGGFDPGITDLVLREF